MTPSSFLEGIAGTVHYSFYLPPPHVDLEKKPGSTSLSLLVPSLTRLLRGYATLSYFFYSPNLIWFILACAIYSVFPYNYSPEIASPPKLTTLFLQRLCITWSYVMIFFGFWHVTLYWLHWSKRPFVSNRSYNWSKVAHNVFYTSLGALQWSAWEIAFLYCYSTKRLLYLSSSAAINTDTSSELSSPAHKEEMLLLILWVLLVPIIREIHFYFCHRFLHTKFLYKYIHSVHHRCADIEPFSGLSMHPTEHLYYFTCCGPLLFFRCPPFIFFWMGVHVLLSPAASHSGWEDHWQSDAYHYIHHRYFECNYGTPNIPFDKWFGTFRDRLDPTSNAPADAKATLLGSPENVAFNILGVFFPCLLLAAAVMDWNVWDVSIRDDINPYLIALVVATAPVWAAAVLSFFGQMRRGSKKKVQKDDDAKTTDSITPVTSLQSSIVLYLGGIVSSILPVYSLITMLLLPKE